MHTKKLIDFTGTALKETASSPLALCILLLALEAVLTEEFTCPCQKWWSGCVIFLIIIGPSLLTFAIMFFHFRLYRFKGCSLKKTDENTFWENLTQCLIPPVVWIIIFFLDGDYVACGATNLRGSYVLNKELNKKWCQPPEWDPKGNESYLLEYHKYLNISQTIGYVLVVFFSLGIIIVSCSDWWKNPKNQQDGVKLADNSNPQASTPSTSAGGNAFAEGRASTGGNASAEGRASTGGNASLGNKASPVGHASAGGRASAGGNASASTAGRASEGGIAPAGGRASAGGNASAEGKASTGGRASAGGNAPAGGRASAGGNASAGGGASSERRTSSKSNASSGSYASAGGRASSGSTASTGGRASSERRTSSGSNASSGSYASAGGRASSGSNASLGSNVSIGGRTSSGSNASTGGRTSSESNASTGGTASSGDYALSDDCLPLTVLKKNKEKKDKKGRKTKTQK